MRLVDGAAANNAHPITEGAIAAAPQQPQAEPRRSGSSTSGHTSGASDSSDGDGDGEYDEAYDLDLGALDPATLRRVEEYVLDCLRLQGPREASGGPCGGPAAATPAALAERILRSGVDGLRCRIGIGSLRSPTGDADESRTKISSEAWGRGFLSAGRRGGAGAGASGGAGLGALRQPARQMRCASCDAPSQAKHGLGSLLGRVCTRCALRCERGLRR